VAVPILSSGNITEGLSTTCVDYLLNAGPNGRSGILAGGTSGIGLARSVARHVAISLLSQDLSAARLVGGLLAPEPRRRSVLKRPIICQVTGSLLTADQVAELLGVPKSWVYAQSRAGRIPTVTLGRYRRYRREAIEAWVGQIEAPGRGAGVRAAAR
jgi:excisionase family DNA binding protein